MRSSRRGKPPGAWGECVWAVYWLWLRTEPERDSAAAEAGCRWGERTGWVCECGDPSWVGQACGECVCSSAHMLAALTVL